MRHRPWYSNERYVAEKKLSLTTFESDQVEGSTRHMAGGQYHYGVDGWKPSYHGDVIETHSYQDGDYYSSDNSRYGRYAELNTVRGYRYYEDARAIKQVFDTKAGVKHTLSFDYQGRKSYGSEINRFKIMVDGKQVGSFSDDARYNSRYTSSGWHEGEVTFTADLDGKSEITFEEDSSRDDYYGRGMFIDNIKLVQNAHYESFPVIDVLKPAIEIDQSKTDIKQNSPTFNFFGDFDGPVTIGDNNKTGDGSVFGDNNKTGSDNAFGSFNGNGNTGSSFSFGGKALDLKLSAPIGAVKAYGNYTAKDSGGKLVTDQVNWDSKDGTKGCIATGSAKADQIFAKAGWDLITGGEGNDLVRAGNGRDVITGGKGADELHGDFGWNTYTSEKDGFKDLIVIKSDQNLVNWLYQKAGNNPTGGKADIIEGLDANDSIRILGAKTSSLVFKTATAHGVEGVGIFAGTALEAVYAGGDLSIAQVKAMTTGDPAAAAVSSDGTVSTYGWTGF